MEITNIDQEIRTILGLNLKENILSEWINELKTKPGFDISNLKKTGKAIVDFIAKNEVNLAKIAEYEVFEMSLIKSEFQVYKIEKNRLFMILDVENIGETYESRHLDSERRTLKFKLTDGFFIYYGLEEQKLNYNQIIMRYKTSVNGKPQPFNLNNLQNKKLLVKPGTIYRRNMLLLKDHNSLILEEYEDLFFERSAPQPINNRVNENMNSFEEEAIVDEFMQFMDEL